MHAGGDGPRIAAAAAAAGALTNVLVYDLANHALKKQPGHQTIPMPI